MWFRAYGAQTRKIPIFKAVGKAKSEPLARICRDVAEGGITLFIRLTTTNPVAESFTRLSLSYSKLAFTSFYTYQSKV